MDSWLEKLHAIRSSSIITFVFCHVIFVWHKRGFSLILVSLYGTSTIQLYRAERKKVYLNFRPTGNNVHLRVSHNALVWKSLA